MKFGEKLREETRKAVLDKGTCPQCKDSVVRGTKWRAGRGEEGREPMWGEWDKVVGRVSKIALKITLAAVGTDMPLTLFLT